MKAPERELIAKAIRCVPGVKFGVAEPNWALDFTSAANCWSVRPLVGGNWPLWGV